jgi:hypothetical protein
MRYRLWGLLLACVSFEAGSIAAQLAKVYADRLGGLSRYGSWAFTLCFFVGVVGVHRLVWGRPPRAADEIPGAEMNTRATKWRMATTVVGKWALSFAISLVFVALASFLSASLYPNLEAYLRPGLTSLSWKMGP